MSPSPRTVSGFLFTLISLSAFGFLPYCDPEVMSLSPPRSYHPDLKKRWWRSCHILTRQFIDIATLMSAWLQQRVHSKDVYFFPDLVHTSDPVLPFLFSSSSWGRLQYSFVLMWWRFTAVVVVWMKCPALVTHTLKTPKKTPITSAGMSRQAMSTTATVGCLNSCYTRFHTILLCVFVSRGYSAP